MAFSPNQNPFGLYAADPNGVYSQQLHQQYLGQLQSAPNISSGMLGAIGGAGLVDMDKLKAYALHALGVIAPAQPSIDLKTIESLKSVEPRKVERRMPDSVSLVTAWRAWGLGDANGEWRLKALGQDHSWEPKKRMEAVCAKGIDNHPAPHFSCECGIWAFKSLDLLLEALSGYTVKVFGNVSLWGRIIETDKGFRAQYAYPKELWLLDSSQEQLGYIYGVPVRTKP